MRLTEIELANFKVFGESTKIPIRPITLIFGPNSSGKSSVLQSLLLMKQTATSESTEGNTLRFSGSLADLGSYSDVVHGHDASKSISVGVRFDLSGEAAAFNGLSERTGYPLDITTGSLKMSFVPGGSIREGILSRINLDFGEGDSFAFEALSQNAMESPSITEESMPTFDQRFSRSAGYSLSSSIGSIGPSFYKKMIEPLLVHAKRNMAEQLKLLRKQLATAPKSALPAREGLHFYTSGPDTKAQVQDKMGELKRLRMALSSYTLETFREDFLYATTRVLVGVRGCILDRSLVLNLNQGILFPNLERLTGSRGMFKTFREAMNQYNVDPYIDFEEYQSAGLDANNPQSVGKFPLEFQSESCLWPLELALTMSDEFRRFLHKLVYVGPMRLFPSRYYLPETIVADTVGKTGEFSPTLLLKEPDLLALVNEWLARLKITYQFEVVKLVAKEADFEEGVFALRLRHRGTAMSSSIVDVGFGVSQLLPVVLQCLLSKKSTICIEQPEIHLHPALQAELGDLFIESALGDDKNTLILETHSEHMILRILKRIRQTSSGTLPTGLAPVTTEQVQVIYVRPTELGTKVHHIGVTDEGEFSDRWPDGFFPERGEELFE